MVKYSLTMILVEKNTKEHMAGIIILLFLFFLFMVWGETQNDYYCPSCGDSTSQAHSISKDTKICPMCNASITPQLTYYGIKRLKKQQLERQQTNDPSRTGWFYGYQTGWTGWCIAMINFWIIFFIIFFFFMYVVFGTTPW